MAGSGTVTVVGAGPTGLALAAELARPDGYIAWASDERDASLRAGQARAAVRAWCRSA